MFEIGQLYSRKDIYALLEVPREKQDGEWDKGYRKYDGNFFIFSNVGIPGRTGHDHGNYWDGELFVWKGAPKSHIAQPQIKLMLSPPEAQKIFLFTRTTDRAPFVFEGNVVAKTYEDTTPVKITWTFEQYPYESLEERKPLLASEHIPLYEGRLTKISVNKYERNPLARRLCIEHFGANCNICDFDFQITYGAAGKGYIHVHHIVPISMLGDDYILNPETDLIPVCPNCHSIIHRKSPIYSIEEMKAMLRVQKERYDALAQTKVKSEP